MSRDYCDRKLLKILELDLELKKIKKIRKMGTLSQIFIHKGF